MATDPDFLQYVIDQIRTEAELTYKKMFGEYLIYLNSKPIVMVCDNIAFVKKLSCIENLLENAEKGYPYQGAKEHYILDIDNTTLVSQVVNILELNVPLPKPKKKK